MLLTGFTAVHALISLIAIAAGFPAAYGLLTHQEFRRSTTVFLVMMLATSVTGFFFSFYGLKPSYIVGAISTVLLIVAMFAYYKHRQAGGWRIMYVITFVFAFYLNVLILIVQSFEKIPVLHAWAPTQTEAPFKDTQALVAVLFIVLGLAACRKKDTLSTPPRVR